MVSMSDLGRCKYHQCLQVLGSREGLVATSLLLGKPSFYTSQGSWGVAAGRTLWG